MPNKAAHLNLAKRNQVLIDHLLPKINEHSDWITTIAFYKALHIVEAIFQDDPKILHGQNHEGRDFFLKANKKYHHIYKQYRPLWAASIVARYLENGSRSVSSFSEFLSPDRVKSEMLDHRLRQIEISAKKTFNITL